MAYTLTGEKCGTVRFDAETTGVITAESMQGSSKVTSNPMEQGADINDHVAIGDTVKVKVMSIDEENKKIALSIRDALPKAPRQQQNFRPREHKNNYEPRAAKQTVSEMETPREPVNDFEEKMKEWLKQSNERQAGINKRNNRRNGGY